MQRLLAGVRHTVSVSDPPAPFGLSEPNCAVSQSSSRPSLSVSSDCSAAHGQLDPTQDAGEVLRQVAHGNRPLSFRRFVKKLVGPKRPVATPRAAIGDIGLQDASCAGRRTDSQPDITPDSVGHFHAHTDLFAEQRIRHGNRNDFRVEREQQPWLLYHLSIEQRLQGHSVILGEKHSGDRREIQPSRNEPLVAVAMIINDGELSPRPPLRTGLSPRRKRPRALSAPPCL